MEKKGSNLSVIITGSLHQVLSYHKEAPLLNPKMIEAQGRVISKVLAKQSRDKWRDSTPGMCRNERRHHNESSLTECNVLTAVLCADNRKVSTTNMHTPPNEMSCSGLFPVSKAIHTTSKTRTTTMKTLRSTMKHTPSLISRLHCEQLFVTLRTHMTARSPFHPPQVWLKAAESRFETPADAFSFVLLQEFKRYSDNSHAGQDNKSNGPLEIQYTGCDEVRHITWRTKHSAP